MKTKQLKLIVAALVMITAFNGISLAEGPVSTTGVSGYDLVSYHEGEKPLRGNGNHVSVVEGATYLFINEKNKQKFDNDPQKYLPAYGGYCAYGVSVGKKFVGDPDVWKLVDGKLYLNLDTKIQSVWLEDIKGNIKKADSQWQNIKDTPSGQL